MHRIQGQGIGLQSLTVQVVDELLLILSTAGQELYRAIAMRTDTLAAPYPGLDVWILQDLMQFWSPEGRRHGGDIFVEHRLSLRH